MSPSIGDEGKPNYLAGCATKNIPDDHCDGDMIVIDENFAKSLSDLTLSGDAAATAVPTASTAAKFWQKSKSAFKSIKLDGKRSPRKEKKPANLPYHQSSLDVKNNTSQLWSCDSCLQINKAECITCEGCQKTYGHMAAGKCFCDVCKL